MLRELVTKLGPSWLTREVVDGEEIPSRVLYAVALVCDALLQRREDGVMAHHPRFAPDDALPYIARDRGILRGPEEPRESLVARLERSLTDHRTRGNAFTLHDQIKGFCQPYPVRVATVDQRGTWKMTDYDGSRTTVRGTPWDWDGAAPFADYRGRFWVMVWPREGNEIFARVKWGSRAWGAPNATWGTTATKDQGRGLLTIMRDWKPAGTKPLYLIAVMDDEAAAFDPVETAPPLPDGTWGSYHVISGGDQVPSRSLDGKYAPY